MRNLLLSVALTTATFRLYSQITLNSSNLFDTGDRIINGGAYSTLDPNIVPGNAGPSQTWNFATTTFDAFDTTNIHAPGWLAPAYTSQCPQTTHVIGYGSNAMNYDLIMADAGGFYIVGNSSYNPNFGIQTAVYQNPVDWMHWPATYGQNYIDTVYGDNTMPTANGSIDSVRTIVEINFTSNIDAWGTMILNSGTYNVLRLKRVLNYEFTSFDHDSVAGWQAPVNSTFDMIMYEWWTDSPGIGYPIVTVYMDQQDSLVQQYNIMQLYTTDIAEQSSASRSLEIYPSPAATEITVRSDETQGTWQIADATGRIVRSGNVNGNTTKIDVSELCTGIYFVTLTDSKGESAAKMFIKE